MRLYGEIIPELYLTCTMISSVDLTIYGVSRAKYRVSMVCGTSLFYFSAQYTFSTSKIPVFQASRERLTGD